MHGAQTPKPSKCLVGRQGQRSGHTKFWCAPEQICRLQTLRASVEEELKAGVARLESLRAEAAVPMPQPQVPNPNVEDVSRMQQVIDELQRELSQWRKGLASSLPEHLLPSAEEPRQHPVEVQEPSVQSSLRVERFPCWGSQQSWSRVVAHCGGRRRHDSR